MHTSPGDRGEKGQEAENKIKGKTAKRHARGPTNAGQTTGNENEP